MKTAVRTSMHQLLWLPIATVVTVMAVLISTIGTASAQELDRAPDAEVDHQIRLACGPRVKGDQLGVRCKWSQAQNDRVRGYQLFRSVNGEARELVTTVGANARLTYFDTDVKAPSKIVYGVVGLNRAGRVIAVSNPVRVELTRPTEELRFDCHRDSIGGERGILCRWSETQRRDARGYLVYRSIGGDEREVIARIGLDGRRRHFDTEVQPGAVHIYYVAVVNRAGEVIGIGGPDRVRWPSDRVTDRVTDQAAAQPAG